MSIRSDERNVTDSAYKVMVMAGGTGGHVYPALAVAAELRHRGCNIIWLGTKKGIEADLVPSAGFAIEWLSISGLRGKSILTLPFAPFRVLFAFLQAVWIMLRQRPDLVLGMGGFASGPGGIAAWLFRRTLMVHEQNAIAGFTNKILSMFAWKVMEAFAGTFPAKVKAWHTGNPLRGELIKLPSPKSRMGIRAGRLRVLVVGGSLGAEVFNTTFPKAIARLPEELRPLIWHQTGKGKLENTLLSYSQLEINVESSENRCVEYIEHMDAAYSWADVVLCRAGAMTISELAIAGVASILVPYPHAVDDHQTANAEVLTKVGGAILLPQQEMQVEKLARLLGSLERDQLQNMAEAAQSQARPDATKVVSDMCMEVMK